MSLLSKPSLVNTDMSAFEFQTLTSSECFKISDYHDKVILIVNTASECGLTGQYQALEETYQKFKAQGLIIIGVPSSDFGNQEKDTSTDIAAFCQKNYGVTFLMTQKYAVTGSHAHPFYKKAKEIMGFIKSPQWNFHKYLINKKGELVDYFFSLTAPDSKRLHKAIESLIHEKEADITEHFKVDTSESLPDSTRFDTLLEKKDTPNISLNIDDTKNNDTEPKS